MSDATTTWNEMKRRHAEVCATGQVGIAPEPRRPAAAVLACSDARVPPSLMFGHPGELFVVRLAGNSATPGAIASLTYAVEQLDTDLVVVLGHTGCGAVQAALASDAPSTFDAIVTPIDEMLTACGDCDDIDAAVTANVRHNVRRLRRDRGPLGHAVRAGRVVLRGAIHDVRTGHLIDLDDHLDHDHQDHDHPSTPIPARSTS
ncbi:carbonic anhydrase [Ilumatobacter sp.]|uniref:carbonic anhydrase n=1 Tax=Ilumatobacter sp. TaxID=1967498 RepID=UPI003AF61EB8